MEPVPFAWGSVWFLSVDLVSFLCWQSAPWGPLQLGFCEALLFLSQPRLPLLSLQASDAGFSFSAHFPFQVKTEEHKKAS